MGHCCFASASVVFTRGAGPGRARVKMFGFLFLQGAWIQPACSSGSMNPRLDLLPMVERRMSQFRAPHASRSK
ncbi:hypothetical protein MPTK1_1g06450 [Marchantia polymorpha subsp. ruderalis]|uniref:Uncharacterized protein n=2 Tax=Marchantia polymorpha TaxID=3197 RepID=A0AAF6AM71_MARPO|nr:hypothetical protein MARPO_0043s0037 [Marchantia polymorpha]BBM97541.1 hypothetical protein Mp_1g06450 [Marchantia polymorpha subsp. ruderalis]|eukprot:PTQ39780.1 hypothetical protein MARPO_0043s0037 [Marchantia polymorpha]